MKICDESEIDRLWSEYKQSPDYPNVERWLKTPTLNAEKTLKHAFRAGICAALEGAWVDAPAKLTEAPEGYDPHA